MSRAVRCLYSRQADVTSFHLSFIVDDYESSPVFDPATMEYMIHGSFLMEPFIPYLQGLVVFKEPTLVPYDVQRDCVWTALSYPASHCAYVRDLYGGDVTEYGTCPFTLQ